MKNLFKGKTATAIVILATFLLAGAAIFTAVRLYQLRQQPVAPNVPSSQPNAAVLNGPLPPISVCTTQAACPVGQKCVLPDGSAPDPIPSGQSGTCTVSTAACSLSITVNIATPSASPSPSVSPSPTPTNTPGPSATPNSCGGSCGSNFNCASDLVCYNGFCRNPSCTGSSSCVCATAGPTGTPIPPTLPSSGTDWPTLMGAGVGIFVIIGSLLLAL